MAKKKWTCFSVYRFIKILFFFEEFTKSVCNMGLNIYDNTIVIGVFILISVKMRVYDKLDVFCYTLNLTNLIKSDTCYPNNHASRIELFLTSKPLFF